ncbi:hypothetical protein [Streptomyces inhibens]|nr:hypothetical protein [Streptomyces inhibens]UKY53563.1 hypothetical protein KI385_35335 [Streptomyces inhibens]
MLHLDLYHLDPPLPGYVNRMAHARRLTGLRNAAMRTAIAVGGPPA